MQAVLVQKCCLLLVSHTSTAVQIRHTICSTFSPFDEIACIYFTMCGCNITLARHWN